MAAASTRRRADSVEGVERRVGDQYGFIRAHGERVFQRILRGLGSNAQGCHCAASGFLLLKRAFDSVLVERVDDQRRVPPRYLPALGFDFRLRVRDLFDTCDDFQDVLLVKILFTTKDTKGTKVFLCVPL